MRQEDLSIQRRERHRGKVRWFNENGGYGFIRRDGGGKDVYVHYSQIEGEGFRTLSEGDTVEYGITEGPKGLHAVGVRIV